MYLLLEPSKDFLLTCKVMPPATLPDIESEMHYFTKKNRVSSSKLSNAQLMFTVSSVP